MPLAPSDILSSDGPIARILNRAFESRPEQLAMADAVARAFETRERLLIEAGTGVGKSFAYLVPAIARILAKGEKVVVATATISLQEQLMLKDIPLLVKAFAATSPERERGAATSSQEPAPSDVPVSSDPLADARGGGSFELKPVLAKGRGNYLSIRRLALASQRQDAILHDDASRRSLHVIEDWALSTRDGSLSTLPALERPDVWDHARSDSDNCMGRKCPHYESCFYQSARRELEQANLIICNHALFFSDLALRARGVSASTGGGAILPEYDHVILDEAHAVEDAACEHFGVSLAQPRVSRLLRTLYSPKRRKGFLLERSLALASSDSVDKALTLVHRAEDASNDFFDQLYEYFQTAKASSGRIRREGVIDNALTPALRELAVRLNLIKQEIESESDRFELSSFAKRAADIADAAEAIIDQTLPDYVYWVEVERDRASTDEHAPSRFGPRVVLSCAPVAVADILKRTLWEAHLHESRPVTILPPRDAGDEFEEETNPERERAGTSPSSPPPPPSSLAKGIILTSATLATRAIHEDEHPERAETAFAHVMSNLGLTAAKTIQLGSPFDYARQSKVIIDLNVPNPREASGSSGPTSPERKRAGPSPFSSSSSSESQFIHALSQRILHHIRATRGGAFVLFTSFNTLHACADVCQRELARLDFPLYVQGRDGSRQLILKNFVESDNAVLFGAASFWQGVDVRGEKLRNVIITRLPFEPPDRPLTQARIERIELIGGNPFMQDSLPRAVIRFKQGFGRLIRSKSDRGQVVILDPRIRTARYGKLFLDALPEGVPVEVQTPEHEEY